jgi:hypothetical protein
MGEENVQGFAGNARWEYPQERDHLEDQGVDGKMVSKWIIDRLAGGVEWIQLARDRGGGRLL